MGSGAGVIYLAAWLIFIVPIVWWWATREPQPAPPLDFHRLEFELGFRDDPPPSTAASRLDELFKDVYTDEPGAVIYYNPAKGTPTYK